MTEQPLRNRRILIVEDNALIALTMEDILARAGAEIVGPVGTLAEAEQTALQEPLSCALLDIKLNYDEVWPVARILADRGVPFVFCSGHFERSTLPNEWAGYDLLMKPARPSHIVDKLASAMRGPGRPDPGQA
jgi:two-component SAPR family response regulator